MEKAFGIREVCELTFRAKVAHKIGNKMYKVDEPVIRFDTAKTSGLEGAATTVYAQGGRGNPRLIAWQGEKTLTLTFEEALANADSLQILMGATVSDATQYNHHFRTRVVAAETTKLDVTEYLNDAIFGGASASNTLIINNDYPIYIYKDSDGTPIEGATKGTAAGEITCTVEAGEVYIVDGYFTTKGVTLSIDPDVFGQYYYIEAETLFRDEATGADKASQIVIPKGQIQNNFTMTMANSGDPSTFTFTVDCMPDYTKGNKTKKVLAELNMAGE